MLYSQKQRKKNSVCEGSSVVDILSVEQRGCVNDKNNKASVFCPRGEGEIFLFLQRAERAKK